MKNFMIACLLLSGCASQVAKTAIAPPDAAAEPPRQAYQLNVKHIKTLEDVKRVLELLTIRIVLAEGDSQAAAAYDRVKHLMDRVD